MYVSHPPLDQHVVDSEITRSDYDAIVQETGCSGSADTLDCLRKVPYAKLKTAIDRSPGIFSYQSLNLAWLPRADGVFLTDAPLKLVQQGKVAKVPIVSGTSWFCQTPTPT